MEIPNDCQILIGQHIIKNAKPTVTKSELNKAFRIYYQNVITILQEFQIEVEAARTLVFVNKINFSLVDKKNRSICLSTKEVKLIQEVVDNIFNAELWIEEHETLKQKMKSPLHSHIFPLEKRGPVTVSGKIDLREKTLKQMSRL